MRPSRLLAAPATGAGGVKRDEVLRRRLARLGLGPKVLRRRPDGDDPDVDAPASYRPAISR